MARRRRHAEHANHERWLVSYADFITLLFAFFVVMFANSQVDREKISKVSESVRGALEQGAMPVQIEGFLGRSREVKPTEKGLANPPPAPDPAALKRMEDLLPTMQQLSADLRQEVDDGKIQVQLTSRGLIISMREAAFFPPADDKINASAYAMLQKLAETIIKLPNPVRMEGHTDSTPIRTARFKSNWELSAARSIAMMELLTGRFRVPREKVAIAGYADTVPQAPNDSAEGRARNRRVDIVILNSQGQSAEPAVENMAAGQPLRGAGSAAPRVSPSSKPAAAR